MRILVVEDEMKLAQGLKKTLESEAYAVDIANDGNTGFLLACDEVYDVIILDVGLPGKDGLTIARELRAEHVVTPILMLTARDTLQNKVSGLDAGADDYLVKPFEFEELLARLRALTRKHAAARNLQFSVDTLTLDPRTKIVKRSGSEISLSAKEYAVLEYLMRHAGTIVSKQQLIDHCWDSELDPFSNTVDVYIGYLRNKIDKAFLKEVPLLKTIKGLGYKIG